MARTRTEAAIPNDVNPARRAELEAAKAKLEPEVRGLMAINNDALVPDETHVAIRDGIGKRQHRLNLIQQELDALDHVNVMHSGLEADGHPNDLPKIQLGTEGLISVRGDVSDVDIAGELFIAEQASTLRVTIGEFTDKPPVSQT